MVSPIFRLCHSKGFPWNHSDTHTCTHAHALIYMASGFMYKTAMGFCRALQWQRAFFSCSSVHKLFSVCVCSVAKKPNTCTFYTDQSCDQLKALVCKCPIKINSLMKLFWIILGLFTLSDAVPNMSCAFINIQKTNKPKGHWPVGQASRPMSICRRVCGFNQVPSWEWEWLTI